MNAQRIPGRRPAAWLPAAALALVLVGLPVVPAAAVPASPEPAGPAFGISIASVWQQLSGWLGEVLRPDRPERGTAAVTVSDPVPGGQLPLDGASSSYRKCEGEDGYKLDPMG